MRTSILASIIALTLTSSLLAQNSRNMTLLSKIPHSPCTTGDVWALDDNHMLIARRGQGFAIVDATNPMTKRRFSITSARLIMERISSTRAST